MQNVGNKFAHMILVVHGQKWRGILMLYWMNIIQIFVFILCLSFLITIGNALHFCIQNKSFDEIKNKNKAVTV